MRSPIRSIRLTHGWANRAFGDAKAVMECAVEDVYEAKGFESFIRSIRNTYADDSVLSDSDEIDYAA